MTKQIKNKARRIAAAMLALTVTAGTLPYTPLSGVFGDVAITASAAEYTQNPTTKDELVPLASSGTVSEAHVVKYANKEWYVIGYDGVGLASESGTMTLFLKGTLGKRSFSDNGSNVYGNSSIHSYLESYLANTENFTSDESGAVVTRVLSGGGSTGNSYSGHVSGDSVNAKLWLLSAAEARKIPQSIIKSGGDGYGWWLRSPGGGSGKANYMPVSPSGNDVPKESGADIGSSKSIRAAMLLDLNSVIYSSETKTLIAQEAESHSITVSLDNDQGSVEAPSRADKGETVSFTIATAVGYEVDTVKFNDTPISPLNGVYSFTMPDNDVTISVTFNQIYKVEDHIEQDGDTYTIKTAKGWEVFCECVKSSAYNGFGNKTVKLGLDITDGVTVSAGIPGKPFLGTFDGDGHTLAVALNSTDEEWVAPFSFFSGSIKNLTVTGTIAGSTYAAGLTGFTYGGSIENVTVSADVSGSSKIGGITGYSDFGSLLVKDTVFNGTLQCNKDVCGLIGWASENVGYNQAITIENCLFNGTYTCDGEFHPITLRNSNSQFAYTDNGAYYTVDPSLSNNNYIICAGIRVSTITVDDDFTITANPTFTFNSVDYYAEGTTITLSRVGSVTGVSVNNGSVEVTDNQDGTYSFTMPAEDVSINGHFSINIDSTIHHGSVTVTVGTTENAVAANEGDTVTLTVTPDKNYVFGSLTVRDSSNNVIEVNNNQFTMPASDVTVSATFTPDSAHFSQSGDTYTIHDETGWDIFCDCLQDNDTYNRFSGKTVVLGDNISVSRMAGSDNHDFLGTFVGNGKTLTFTATAADNYLAPFRNVLGSSETDHAVIRNLNVETNITANDYRHMAGLIAVMTGYVDVEKCNVTANINNTVGTNNPSDLYPSGIVSQVASSSELSVKGCTVGGTIATNGKYAAGIIGIVQGSATIENSVSGVTINSSKEGDGTHGGFVGVTNKSTTLKIKGCVFNGKLLGSTTDNCGGFVGWRNGGAEIYNSIFDPAEVTIKKDGSATFARNKIDTYNSYYTYLLNDGTNYAPYLDDGSVTPKKYNNGQQAYTITHGTDVSLGLSGTPTEYDVSGITVYAGNSGIRYGNTFYACSGDDVALELEYTGTPAAGYIQNGFTASAGTLSGTTLTMPAENVTINADFDVESYFNAGKLTLKGTIVKKKYGSIVLPDGVNENDVQKIDVDSSGATLPQNSSWLFDSFTNVTSIDLTGADTSNVTDMNNMFRNCSKVTELDVSGFDTSSVTDMNHMFYNCESLTELDVSGFITSSVTDMSEMFDNCESLTELDVSGFDTGSVEDMKYMFQLCKNLTTLDLSSFNTGSVTNMDSMFDFCSKLTTIYVSDKWDAGRVTDSDCMFSGCSKLTGGNNTAFDGNYTDKDYARIDKDGQPGYLTGVYTLTLPDDLEMVTDADENMKVGIGYLKGAEVTLRYTGTVPTGHYLTVNVNGTATTAVNGVCKITIPDSNAIVTTETIDAFDENTATLTLKGTILKNGQGINLPEGVQYYDVKHIVVDPTGATLPQDSSYLFFSFGNVESIDLTGADTSSVTNMGSMFSDCIGLQTIDLSGFDTSSVTNMYNMFYRCKMTELDLSGFDTSQVTDMSGMFGQCKNLTTLDLSSFDTRLVNGMFAMFQNCTGLETIYVGEKWNTDSVSSNDSSYLFDGCTKLTGGSGTAYDSNYTDKTYAVIDKDGQPGYLTGVYTLTLPVNMEIVTDADKDMKVGSRYLKGAVLTFKAKTGYTVGKLEANGTVLTADENGIYTVTISDSDVTVEIAVFDESTGTLTLKGIVENGSAPQGIILPDGVSKTDVRHIVVDPAGATLPLDSSYLFSNFTSVKSIDLRGADTSKVQDMCSMFGNCRNLTSLDLSSFDTSNVTDTGWMFYSCENLTTLDLSSFNTSKVRNMDNMFYQCKKLITLDLSSFNTGIVIKMNSMFKLCSKLTTIYVSDKWSTESVYNSENMFSDCSKLTGGNGTACDSNHTDKTYAVIDKEGQPGYLTGVYTLTLPDNMEIVTNADEDMKVGGRYLKNAEMTLRYKGTVEPGYVLIVKANGTDLTEENGVYTITMPDSDVTVTAELVKLITPDMFTLSGEGFEDNRFIHDGSEKTVTVTVKDGDKTLAEGTDYTVSGNTGTETGSYTLTVTGIGDYTGAFVNVWKIVSGNVSITYETPAGSTTVTAQVGQMMKIIAPETDDGGKNFAYWQDADGKIISYSSDYRFIVKKPMVLTAVYAEVSEPGKVLILEAAKASHDGRNNVCLTFDRSIPYDQDIIGAGIIYTTNKLLGDSTNTEDLRSKDGFGSDSIIAALKARGTNVIVDNFDETSCNGTINVYIPVGNNTDAYIYAIAYVASENGDETVYDYSELVAATYNTAAEM